LSTSELGLEETGIGQNLSGKIDLHQWMSVTECRMVMTEAINPDDRWERLKVDVEAINK
jgi:hypothetical protein